MEVPCGPPSITTKAWCARTLLGPYARGRWFFHQNTYTICTIQPLSGRAHRRGFEKVQSYTVFAGNGMEPVRVIQLYGYARAHGDAERMELNERFLQKIFEESNSNANLPVILLGDFNVEPQYSPTISFEVNTGNCVDVGRSCAEARGEQPKWTFRQGDVTSRIDLCLLNGAAMNLFENSEMWDHAGCTIPNHECQQGTQTVGDT